MSIDEILMLDDVKPISASTVNKNLKVVIAFMNWTKRQGYVRENYFEGLKLPKVKKAQDERKPFSEEDIKMIFNPATYLKAVKDKPSRYWVPLLALFTGARLNELCQLHVDETVNDSVKVYHQKPIIFPFERPLTLERGSSKGKMRRYKFTLSK